MPTVKLRIVEGYGTAANPYMGGTQRETDIVLKENEHIRAVLLSDFVPDDEGNVRTGTEEIPVIPYEFINHLIGRLLTVSDAAFSDKEQRKAFKDILTQTVWQWYQGQGTADPR